MTRQGDWYLVDARGGHLLSGLFGTLEECREAQRGARARGIEAEVRGVDEEGVEVCVPRDEDDPFGDEDPGLSDRTKRLNGRGRGPFRMTEWTT